MPTWAKNGTVFKVFLKLVTRVPNDTEDHLRIYKSLSTLSGVRRYLEFLSRLNFLYTYPANQ